MDKNYYAISPEFAALMQGSVQYTTGVATGYLIDQAFSVLTSMIESPATNTALMIVQAGINGLALRFILPYLHGEERLEQQYIDPTGGYLMAMGLFHGQPKLAEKSRVVIGGLIDMVEERFDPSPTPEISE